MNQGTKCDRCGRDGSKYKGQTQALCNACRSAREKPCIECGDTRSRVSKIVRHGVVYCENVRACNTRAIKDAEFHRENPPDEGGEA